MYRMLSILAFVCIGSHIAGHTAAATPPRALIEAAGLSVVDPAVAAPVFTLNDHHGRPLMTRDQRGKVLLVNFWATWCPPCIHEMPLMDKLFVSMQGRPFTLWALNIQETQEDVAKFLQSRDFRFPVLLDAEGKVMGNFQVKGLPSTYLIDCGGNLIGSITGVLKWTDDAMQKLLETLFQDPACQAKTASKGKISHDQS